MHAHGDVPCYLPECPAHNEPRGNETPQREPMNTDSTTRAEVFASGVRKDSNREWWFLHALQNAPPWSDMLAVDRSRLIAAAPALLEALQAVVAHAESDDEPNLARLRTVINQARAAIARTQEDL